MFKLHSRVNESTLVINGKIIISGIEPVSRLGCSFGGNILGLTFASWNDLDIVSIPSPNKSSLDLD